MDANTIRIILIIVGALLILALYLWERGRDAEELEYEDDEDYGDADAPYGLESAKRESRVTRAAAVDDVESVGPVRVVGERPKRTAAPQPVAALPPDEPAPTPAASTDPHGADVDLDEDETDLEPLLIQLSVTARRDYFGGEELMDIAADSGLRPGRMDIFHCLDEFDDDTRVYFSMANMVKPGTFPFNDMSTFSTPGVMLFAQLDGRPEDITILEEMIATARKLATELDGEVRDETRRPLTVRKEESLREAVLENERRWARRAER